MSANQNINQIPAATDQQASTRQILSDKIRETILTALNDAPGQKPILPSDIARTLYGKDETKWRLAMKPIRSTAIAMAQAGEIRILRKGKTADPLAFKGVYQIALPI